MKIKEWSSQWTQFMQLREEAWKKFRTSTGFEPVTSRFTGAMLYQLSYEATDVGSRSIVGSYVPVKEMSANDIWNKSYMNCGQKWNENEEMIVAVNAIAFTATINVEMLAIRYSILKVSQSANPNVSSFGYKNRYYTWTSK